MIARVNELLPVDPNCPMVRDHPLNLGRTVWWLSLPALAGSRHFHGLASNAGTGDKLGLLDLAVASPGGWVSSTRPGALGPAVRLSSADHDNIVSGTNGVGLISSNVITAAAGSLAIWVRPTDAAATNTKSYLLPTIAGDGNNQFWGLHYGIISGTNNIWAYGWDGAEKKVGGSYTLSQWVRAVWVHGGGTVFLYLNGVLAGSVACGSITTMSSQFHVSTYTAGYFGGDVDDVAVWNRALTASEVWLDYQESRAGYPGVLNRITPLGLIALPPAFPVSASSSATLTPTASSGVARPKSASDSFIVTPTASSVVLGLPVGTGSVILTPAASSVVARAASASSQVIVTPESEGGLDRAVSASSSFTLTPSSASVFDWNASASSLIRFFPEPLAGFGWSVGASSEIVLTPSDSVFAFGSKPVSATSQIVLTPQADELFAHGILADAHSQIILTPTTEERVPGPIFVSVSGDNAPIIILTPGASSGVDRHSSASNLIILTASDSVELVPEPAQERSLNAEDERIILSPYADAVIVRSQFDELGRYRRGDKVVIGTILPGIPDSAPIAVIISPDSQIIGAYELPISDATRVSFALPVQVNLAFAFGTYRVSYQFTIGGHAGVVKDAEFQVIPGGDSGGEVISMLAFDRPEARFLIAQLNSGRLVVGRNPSTGE